MDPIVRTMVVMGAGIAGVIIFSMVGLVVVSGNRRQKERQERKARFNPNVVPSDNPDRAARRREIRESLNGDVESGIGDAAAPMSRLDLPDGDNVPSVDDLLGIDSTAPSASPAPAVPTVPSTPSSTPARPRTQTHQTAAQPVAIKLHTGHTAQANEIFSILRDERDGQLLVLMGDTAYRTLADLPDTRKNFSRIMKELAGIMKPDDNAPQDDPQADVVSTTEAAPVAPPQPSLSSNTTEEAGPLPGDLPDYTLSPTDNIEVGRLGQVKVTEIDSTPIVNMADAIEQYLQYKIENAPQFQQRGIHIRPTASGGLFIEVDGKRYEFVDEVEDVEARGFIQTAISEWQERH